MFGKRKQSSSESPARQRRPGKGRPTPTRKEAEAARRRDMIPRDRKLAKKLARERQNEMWRRQQQAMETGDERYLPLRDRGRIRRFTRDYIDARWSLAEFVLPAMFILILAMLGMVLLVQYTSPQMAQFIVSFISWGTYGLLFLSVGEAVWVNHRIKKLALEKYPQEEWPRRSGFYVFSRMVMARRWRQPKPQVARGEFPQKRSSKR
ncbi:MAG: DUF3043 domain-containing protein [Actinomycetaceae bacterium]|nr:DUF3043 domain-containing protein [Actinomycetaceae bacterium]